MTKARELLQQKEQGERRVMTSGVEVLVRPFPSGLWEKINQRALKDFPEPTIPKKTIEVLGGTEEVDDLNNPEYLAQKQKVTNQRNNFLGEAILDLCVEVDMEKWEKEIKKIERYSDPYPTDPDERRLRFLSDYAIRSAGDWQFVFASAIEQAQATEPEVAERIDSFQHKVAQSANNGATPPGTNEVKRLDVQPAV